MNLDQLSPQDQLSAIKNKWHKLRRMHSPHQVIQEAAVFADPNNIQFIDNPSFKTQLLVLKMNPTLFYHFNNTDFDSIKTVAVTLYPRNIMLIEKPSIDLITLAIFKQPTLFELLRVNNVFKDKRSKRNVDLTEFRTIARFGAI